MAFGEELAGGGLKRERDRLKRRDRGRSFGDEPDEQLFEFVTPAEEHLTLVGEVAKKGALGDSGPRGDLDYGRLLVAVLDEQFHRGLLQAFLRTRFPSDHDPDPS